jgi:hypothetical protein
MGRFMKLRARLANSFIALGNALSPAAKEAVVLDVPQHPEHSQDAAIKNLLESCARAFVPGDQHVRANVMTFSADRTRRQVNRLTAFNMDTDADCDLEIDATAAASGKAVTERRATIADLVLLQITTEPAWGLRASELARVRPTLKSILSVPVFNPKDVDGPLLGTLQVDSDLTMEEAGFIRPESAELLQQFADVLSLLVIGVDVRMTDAKTQKLSLTPKSRVQNATQVEPGLYVANATTSIFQLSKGRYS